MAQNGKRFSQTDNTSSMTDHKHTEATICQALWGYYAGNSKYRITNAFVFMWESDFFIQNRGWKTIETRTHNRFKCLRGSTILIHAGMSTDDSHYATQNPYLTRKQILENPDEMVNGYILCIAYVHDFKPLNNYHSSYALIECSQTTRYGLFLKDIETFKQPIPVKGEMGIWYFDLDKMEKVKKPAAKPRVNNQSKLFL